jgi:prevent-host-death family protein
MIAEEVVGISEAKSKLTGIVRRLQSGEQARAFVFKQNRPVAVILPVDVYERLSRIEEDLEHFEDALALARARELNDGTTWSLDEVAKKLDLE